MAHQLLLNFGKLYLVSSIIELINSLRVADKSVNKEEDLTNKKFSLHDVIKSANIYRNF